MLLLLPFSMAATAAATPLIHGHWRCRAVMLRAAMPPMLMREAFAAIFDNVTNSRYAAADATRHYLLLITTPYDAMLTRRALITLLAPLRCCCHDER